MPATSFLWTTLFFVVIFAVAVYVVVSVRRTRREHRARSDERAAAMMLTLQSAAGLARAASSAAAAPATAVPAPSRANPSASSGAQQTPALTRRARLLTDTQRLLYLVLRSGMPDHAIMVNVRIVDLAEAAVSAEVIERDARLRELARERADFLVCNADLVPVAALVVYEAGIAEVPDERVKVTALRELGVKFLRFRADSLPRPAEVRALILG